MRGTLLLAAFVTIGCAQKVAIPEHPECGYEVIFSLANQDRLSPVVLADLLVNDNTIFHGALGQSQSGDYVYLSIRIPTRKMTVEVRTETGGEVLSTKKNIWVEDRPWIVITRTRKIGDGPELQIEVSYENPWPLKRDKAKDVSIPKEN